MSSNKMESCLEEVKREFNETPDKKEIEEGLDTKDSMEIQLRKACRLLEASKELLEEKSYYIIVIDACFTAIERSIQARLYEVGALEGGKAPQKHEKTYEEGKNVGIYGENFSEDLKRLWKENRSKHYYREGIPSYGRAEKIYDLAVSIHEEVVGMSREGHECLCQNQ